MQTLENYYSILTYIYTLEVDDLFTLSNLSEVSGLPKGQARTLILSLCDANFAYPVGNKGYKINQVKRGFLVDYTFSLSPKHVAFTCSKFEIIFKNSNYFLIVDHYNLDVEKIKTDFCYLISLMFISLKGFRIYCESDIYSNNGRIIFKRRYFSCGTNIELLSCTIRSENKHLTYGSV